ncbi:MAG: glutaminyl-peptide cyclotransferase [Pseudomonadales bacterium]
MTARSAAVLLSVILCCCVSGCAEGDAIGVLKESKTLVEKNRSKTLEETPKALIYKDKHTGSSQNPSVVSRIPTVAHASHKAVSVGYTIVAKHPHNPKAFTQGLLFDRNDQLLESSGNYGASYIARMQPGSANNIEQQQTIAKQFFAEGLALSNNRLYLLTWKAGTALVFNASTLAQTGAYKYKGQGWGLTANAQQLIMSNGSDELQFRNPLTFALQRTLPVRINGKALDRLNELEWANGLIYANIWYSDKIVGIDPETGNVVQTLDMSALREEQRREPRNEQTGKADVLNGIAFNAKSGNFWLSGKYWSTVYEIRLEATR